MNRLLRRGATLLAATMTAALLLPGTGAQAATNITPCDNETPVTAPTTIVLPGGLGSVIVQVQLSQDTYVQYDGPGTPLDTEVGIDVQSISLAESTTLCLLLPVVGGIEVSVTPVTLHVEVCFFSGQPWTITSCPIFT